MTQDLPGAEETELEFATQDLQDALVALQGAQVVSTGPRPWAEGKPWDVAAAARALAEAESRVRSARERLARATQSMGLLSHGRGVQN